jgi:hypothetical protein
MDVDHSNRCSLAIFIARGSIQNTSMRSTTAAADKTDKIAITPSRSILQKIEKVRGDIPRSTYIRRALQNYLKQGKKG